MNTNELVIAIAQRTGLPREDVKRTLDALRAVIEEVLSSGGEVQLRGLVTIGARWTEARALRSVSDQQRLVLDGRWAPRLRAADTLRAVLMRRSPQRWRDPRHQAAWRLADALVGDLDLYHRAQVPALDPSASFADIARDCADAFGTTWERVLATWTEQIPAEVREEGQQLLRVALQRWGVADLGGPIHHPGGISPVDLD